MPPTTQQNAEDIKDVERKLDGYKDTHGDLHRQMAASMGGIEGTLASMNGTLSGMKDDLAETKQMVPVVKAIAAVDLPAIKQEQEQGKSFRWRTIGVSSVLVILLAAFVSGAVAFGFNKAEDDKYIERSDIQDPYSFIESVNGKPLPLDCTVEENKDTEECKKHD